MGLQLTALDRRLSAIVRELPDVKAALPRIEPGLAGFLLAKRIHFSATIKKEGGRLPAGAEREGFQEFRGLFGADEARLVRREIAHTDLEDDPADGPFAMADGRTQLHLRVFRAGDGRPVVTNCVNTDVIAVAEDPGSSIFRFLRQHPALDSVSLHIGGACEDVSLADEDEHWIPLAGVYSKAEVVERMNRTLAGLERNARRAGFTGGFRLENLDYHYPPGRSAYQHVTEPGFIGAIFERFPGYDILVDPAHLLVSAVNMPGYGPDRIDDYHCDLLAALDPSLHRLREIHLAVPEDRPGSAPRNMHDSHRSFRESLHGPRQPEALAILGILGDLLLRRDRLTDPPPLLINFETPLADLPGDARLVVRLVRLMREQRLLAEA